MAAGQFLVFRRYVPSGSTIIAISEEKKTANEAENVCSCYGGALSQLNNMETIRTMLIEEYAISGWCRNYFFMILSYFSKNKQACIKAHLPKLQYFLI